MGEILYTYGDGLYINMTNRCPCKCEFCVRQMADGLGGADSLWLEKEPTVEDVIAGFHKWDLSQFDEVIFCGYGEPLVRLDDVLEVCRYVKEHTTLKTRINTNGLSDLIHGKPTGPMLSGLVDGISISLNEADGKSYDSLCHPAFGESSYEAILTFIKEVKKYVPQVAVSIVSVIPPESVEKCRKIAAELGVAFKIR